MRICAQSINESLYRIDTPCFVPFRRITLFGKRRVELNAISLFLFISRIRDAHPVSRCAKHELRELRNNAIFHTHCTYQTLCVPFPPSVFSILARMYVSEHGIMRSLPGLYKDCIVGINGLMDSVILVNVMRLERLKLLIFSNMGMILWINTIQCLDEVKKSIKILNFFFFFSELD